MLEMQLGDVSVSIVLFKGLNRFLHERFVRHTNLLAQLLAVCRDLLPIRDQFVYGLDAFTRVLLPRLRGGLYRSHQQGALSAKVRVRFLVDRFSFLHILFNHLVID